MEEIPKSDLEKLGEAWDEFSLEVARIIWGERWVIMLLAVAMSLFAYLVS